MRQQATTPRHTNTAVTNITRAAHERAISERPLSFARQFSIVTLLAASTGLEIGNYTIHNYDYAHKPAVEQYVTDSVDRHQAYMTWYDARQATRQADHRHPQHFNEEAHLTSALAYQHCNTAKLNLERDAQHHDVQDYQHQEQRTALIDTIWTICGFYALCLYKIR